MNADFASLLSQLADQLDAGRIRLTQAAHEIARHACAAVACSQASLWVLKRNGPSRFMQRVGGFDALSGRVLDSPAALADAEFADYFDTLTQRAVCISEDALADVRLAAMRETYLIPQGVGALLDAAVGVNGSSWGVLCCEHRGGSRRWTAFEVAMVKRMADGIALRSARRQDQGDAPGTLMGGFVELIGDGVPHAARNGA